MNESTYHWAIICPCGCCHWLRWPRTSFTRWIPLSTSVERINKKRVRNSEQFREFNKKIKKTKKNLLKNRKYDVSGFVNAFTHFTWAVAALLIVRFSANDANELSKSPVSTLPVGLGCGWFGCGSDWPPVFDKLKPWTFPDWVDVVPADAVEAGFKTSPSASKPFYLIFFYSFFLYAFYCQYFLFCWKIGKIWPVFFRVLCVLCDVMGVYGLVSILKFPICSVHFFGLFCPILIKMCCCSPNRWLFDWISYNLY